MEKYINTGLISNPWNWGKILLMIVFGGLLAELVFRGLTSASGGNGDGG